MTLRPLILMISLLALSTGCTFSRSQTAVSIETLLTNSSEVVSFPISDRASVHTIQNWIGDEAPSYATVSCPTGNPQCAEVTRVLNAQNITVDNAAGASDTVTLSYDHPTARNCPPQAFGCSVAANSLQMISNYNQILHPAVSDPQDAAQGVKAYKQAHDDGL